MNSYILADAAWSQALSYFLPAFILSLVMAAVIIYALKEFSRGGRKAYRSDRLRDLLVHDIAPLVANAHESPLEAFRNSERLVHEYGYSKAELGISMRRLLGHAFICQAKIIQSVRSSLEDIRTLSIKQNAKPIFIEQWASEAKTNVCAPLTMEHDRFVAAMSDYYALKSYEERYCPHDQEPSEAAEPQVSA